MDAAPSLELVQTADLRASLESALRRSRGAHVSIAALDRTMSPYGSSFALEELAVTLDDGEQLSVMFKNLDRMLSLAARAKPQFVVDPRREIEVYHRVLGPLQIGPACYYDLASQDPERHWLFIEKISGPLLWQVGDFEVWRSTARWLARMHKAASRLDCRVAAESHLLRCDAAFFARWIDRAITFAEDARRSTPLLRQFAASYESVIGVLTSLPTCFIHGEFYASNIVVAEGAGGIYPVDWEMAGTGPALLDLAALVSGHWTAGQRADLARAYYDEAADASTDDGFERFSEQLACCRLHVAIQWLGWSRDWSPPAEHEYDWLQDVAELVETLGV